MSLLNKIFGDPNQKYLKTIEPIITQINQLESEFVKLSNEQLKQKTQELKEKLKQGEKLDDILSQAFALVREGAKRTLGQRHFDAQLIGGVVLHQGKIAEMKTGEGKTLVATLPVYLNALAGQGVHVITVNDYLAERDTVWMGQIYHALGLSVACIVHDAAFVYDPSFVKNSEDESQKDKGHDNSSGASVEMQVFQVAKSYLRPVSRREAYLADITYGTNNEFGFDYLRDNLVYDPSQLVQRDFYYAIVDEVDSILIDEARTPLIISGRDQESGELYIKLAQLVKRLKAEEDYNIDEKMKSVALTEKGQEKVAQWLGLDPWQTNNFSLIYHLEAALRAEVLFHKDKDYVVKEGEIIIVDEFTGRLMFGRRYSEGLHQAIEAKEGVQVKEESRTLATVTFQNYFRMYKKLAGMTGTAATEAEEFSKIYKLDVVTIPTNKKLIRAIMSDKIYQTEEAKLKALAQEIKDRHAVGQPILVGTTSIEKNEKLHQLLELDGVVHQMLNAKNHEKEGQIIAQAGRLGAVTIATNMAGRGVDIILGGNPADPVEQQKVITLGGLHVVGTERHESRRIDNQLRGRAGRQGDPGSSQFFLSLEDDLMRIFGGDKLKNLMMGLRMPEEVPIENGLVSRSIDSAQQKVEGINFDMRKHLLDYDDVLNKQREAVYRKRREFLFADYAFLRPQVIKMINSEIERVVSFHTVGDAQENWNLKEIAEVMRTIFPCPADLEQALEEIRAQAGERVADVYARDRMIKYFSEIADLAYQDLEKKVLNVQTKTNDFDLLLKIEKSILLQSIDYFWTNHLEVMENLKGGIGLRAYGQRDPLVEYKRESYLKFNELLAAIEKQAVYTIYKIGLADQMNVEKPKEIQLSGPAKVADGQSRPVSNKKMPGRNDPCPCGSGKKYKKCCGGR